MPTIKNAQLICVPKGSVTEEEKSRVVTEFTSIGIQVVFLEYGSGAVCTPEVHLMTGWEPQEKVEWTPTEPEPTS